MLPFDITLNLGEAPYKQIVFAAHKAMISGVLKPGDAFPSVRAISKELKINPNTVQKAISLLVQQGMLEIQPGVGAWVCHCTLADPEQKRKLLTENLDSLIVEAKRLGISKAELIAALHSSWKKL